MKISWVSRFGALCAEKEGGWFCHYCARKVNRTSQQGDIDKATIDHKTPRSKGGESKFSNFVLCCSQCNTEKADQPYLSFWLEKQGLRLRNIANREFRPKKRLTRMKEGQRHE